MLGMDSRNFLLESGTLFLLFLSWCIFAVVYFIVWFINSFYKSKRIAVLLDLSSTWLFFNYIIRVLLESYIDLLLTAILNLQEL